MHNIWVYLGFLQLPRALENNAFYRITFQQNSDILTCKCFSGIESMYLNNLLTDWNELFTFNKHSKIFHVQNGPFIQGKASILIP